MITQDFSYKIYNNNILHLEWAPAIDIAQMQKIKHFASQIKDHYQIHVRHKHGQAEPSVKVS